MDIKRIETLTTSELLSEGQVARLRAREENETQRVLRSALERLGPNGEFWGQGSAFGRDKDKHCVISALHGERLSCYSAVEASPEGKALIAAGGFLSTGNYRSIDGVWMFNDNPTRTFPEIRALYHRAITLAATP